MYTPFNIKTDNTFLTSMIQIKDLIKYALNNNIKSLSITDNNLYGVMDFYTECINNSIKPIVGLDLNYNGNLLLYCKDIIGYKNLLKLNSIDNITITDLNNYKDSIVCILPYESINNYNELNNIYKDLYIGYKNKEQFNEIKHNKKVYINDILCLEKDDMDYLKYLYCIKNDEYLDRVNVEFKDNYLKILKEESNKEITNMCNFHLDFNMSNLIPEVDNNSYELLKQLCLDGLKNKLGNLVPNKYLERLKYELKIIKDMNYCNYFLIVQDYVSYAKKIGGNTCLCRGSAAGSLVSYLIDITDTDPLLYNLYFERFLNPERVTMPDIDIDFKGSIREEVVKYCISKYGLKKVAPIITFQTLQAKQAIKDIFKVLDIPDKQKDKVSKLLDSKLSLTENLKNEKLKNYLDELELNDAYNIAIKFEGMKKTSSVHAAGVVMCNIDIDNIIPLKKYDDYYITGIDATYLERIGLLKMDLLTVRTLDLLSDMLNDIGIDYNDIPLDDPKTIEVFKNGDTLGIFQFEKEGITQTIKKMQPNNLFDIYNALALYRPGPMQNIDKYINRKIGKEKVNYLHISLKPILNSTYGVIIYQEQIMEIAKQLANFTMSDADNLRRAMSKKKKELLVSYKEQFINGCINNNIDNNIATKIFDLMYSFASYGFNKSHSVVYGVCAYKMGYIKANYPDIYFKHLLKKDLCTSKHLYEMKKYKVNIIKPDINKSGLDYIYDNGLIYPISNIKGSESIAKQIVENKPYNNIYSLFETIPNINKEQIIPLILTGCFDSFGYNRKTLIENLDDLINYGDLQYTFKNQESLKPIINTIEEYSKKELLDFEYNYLGFYLSSNPVSLYKSKYNSIDIKDINKYFNKYVDLVVMIEKIGINKSNKPTCFITGVDEYDSISVILFNNIYEQNKNIKKNDIIHVYGKISRNYGKDEILVSNIEILSK